MWNFSFRAEHLTPRAEFPRLFSVPVSEAVFRRCSRKKVFLKNFAKFKENTYVRVSFLNKVACLRLVQNIGLLKYANFVTDMQKNNSKTQFCEQIQCYEKSSPLHYFIIPFYHLV